MDYTHLIAILLGTLFGYFARTFLQKQRETRQAPPELTPPELASPEPAPLEPKRSNIYAIAKELNPYFELIAYPKDLLKHDAFKEGVELLSHRSSYTTSDLLAYYSGANVIISCMALEALSRRREDGEILEPILASINAVSYWVRYFALGTLNACMNQPIVGMVLTRIDNSWMNPATFQILREFLAERVAKGETPTFGERLNSISEGQAELLSGILRELDEKLVASLETELRLWQLSRIDTHFLKSIGKVWETSESPESNIIVEHNYLLDSVFRLEATLLKTSPRSVILVGESGVGKTAIIRVLAKRLQERGWVIFEASASDVLAGQVYIGELEGRVQGLVHQIGGRRVLRVVPNFHELMWAGRHRYNPTGVLDMLLPHIESGVITLIGETQPIAYERLVQSNPRLRTALETSRVHPLDDSETLELARHWAARYNPPEGPNLISEQTLGEAFQLAQQYLGDKAAPGNLLQFLMLTRSRLAAGNASAPVQISLDDLLVTLSQLTSLPASILDDREGLNLEALREHFQQRVLGQPEAINCLVERVAMIKAGLTDPTRPQGVFLFVGPTGTGKTEIAKTLAEFLFGSSDRMIRLDMSEFQTVDSLNRILGEYEEISSSTSLVDQIRKQPFSVVLLDEFEKANPNIWDLFLQVFDDGRLTDRRGNTTDFRHCIIIMTSNLGAAIPRGASIGFTKEDAGFIPGSVERAVKQTFRREFLNRIDRLVVFHPLSRGIMREILQKELSAVLRRRGLRNRAWAVEWDDSAIEFLLVKGFTADLGARPLKRAVEHYLLSPLAMTIVNHQFPEGDQFLFVRGDGKGIEVEFIDPDVPEDEVGKLTIPLMEGKQAPERKLRLGEIVLDPQGTLAEVEFLQQHYDRLTALIESDSWQQKKQAALSQTASPGFWNSPERFSILGLVEYMDRIEVGLGTAGSLLNRLIGPHPGDRKHFSSKLLQPLAQQIYLVDTACTGLAEGHPRDAFLLIEAGRDPGVATSLNDEFAMRLGKMYQQWAAKRKMELAVLQESGGNGVSPYRLLIAVSGYAAFILLAPEAGLHVFEIPREGRSFQRCKVRVRVAAQPDEPVESDLQALCAQAIHALAQVDTAKLVIVRRYRERPSPLVRDSVRRWRTGKLDRVLGGDFDLIS